MNLTLKTLLGTSGRRAYLVMRKVGRTAWAAYPRQGRGVQRTAGRQLDKRAVAEALESGEAVAVAGGGYEVLRLKEAVR